MTKDVIILKAKFALLMLWCFLLCGCSEPIVSENPRSEATELSTDAATEMAIPESSAPPTTVPDISISVPSGTHRLVFEDDATGDYLEYYLFVPENAVKGMPLIVFLHGDGEVGNPDALEHYGPIIGAKEIYGDSFPFILISPATRQKSWTNGTIPETLMNLIRYIILECEIDASRVTITGHSRGAIGTWYLLSTYGDFFAAAVPVSCGSDCVLNYENLAKVPIYALVGNAGTYEIMYMNAMQNIVYNVGNHGGDVEFKVLEGLGHDDTSEMAYTQEVFEWILEQ